MSGEGDSIRKLADELEAATGIRPTTFVAAYPLHPTVKEQVELSPCLGSYEIDLESGTITFEVLPP